MFKRLTLFLLTNLAVLAVLGIVITILGVTGVLPQLQTTEGVLYYFGLLVFAAFWGFTGAIISLLLSKSIAKWSTGAHVITQPQNEFESFLVQTVGRQAQAAGIGMPEVAIYAADDPNAFATGWSRNNALVAVSTGLANLMSRDEIEAVLAHEVSHVANGDMVTLTLIQGVLNTFVIFLSRVIGMAVDKAIFKTRHGVGPGYWITVIVMQILLGIIATMVIMWFSRQREFRADEGGARLAGAGKMASALARLQQVHEPGHLPEALSAMGIRGSKGGGFQELFRSHPPLEVRIARLRALPNQ